MTLKKIYLSIFLAMMVIAAIAQPGVGDPNGGGKPGTVPISGIEILIALGGALGLKKIISSRNTKK